MQLHSGPLSLFTAKVRIALDEKRLAYERIDVGWSLASRYAPHHPEVVARNPKRQVPVLVDEAVTVYDSTLIFESLEDPYPDPLRPPASAPERARSNVPRSRASSPACTAALRARSAKAGRRLRSDRGPSPFARNAHAEDRPLLRQPTLRNSRASPERRASTLTFEPSGNSPSRIFTASGSCTMRWITRLSGRAP